MKNALKYSIAAALIAVSGLSTAFAHGFSVGELKIGHPWAKPTITGAKVGGGYLKITNEGKIDDRLVSISTDRAASSQLHEMKVENDIMKMRELENGVPVPAGATVELKPGGNHIMFMNIPQSFAEGDKFKATLTFEKAGTVEVEFIVEQPKDGAAKEDHSGHAKP